MVQVEILYLFISIDNHDIFKRAEENLYYELPISFTDAALGTQLKFLQLMEVNQKLKYQLELNMVNNLDLKEKECQF